MPEQAMTTEAMVVMFALMGVVILVSALLSGFIERSNFPQVAAFLGLGAALGPHGAGVLDIGLDAPILRVVATLSLALVLFTDALTIDVREVKRHAGLAALILGPGTILAALVIAIAGAQILGLPFAAAVVLAAPLASTDPILLRGLLRRPDIAAPVRHALRLESSLNDVVLLPMVIVGAAFMKGASGATPNILDVLFRLLILGPGVGVLVAWAAIKSLGFMRQFLGVRRDYESLYSLGIAMAAFAAAEALHGSGFLAAFAAGLTISILDVELCDCFQEYGETTAEMLLLFTFVLLGGSLIWTGLDNLTWPVILFAVVALAARPVTMMATLMFSSVEKRQRTLITWFGPRGLSTLLLVLVAVFDQVPGAERLFEICSLVVIASVLIHGGSLMALKTPRKAHVPKAAEAPIEEIPFDEVPALLTAQQVQELTEEGKEVWLVDVRSTNSYLGSEEQLQGSTRIDPEQARRSAEMSGIPKDAWVALFCT